MFLDLKNNYFLYLFLYCNTNQLFPSNWITSLSTNDIISVKGSMFLKNRHFIIQERFNKLRHDINTIIKCGTWQPVKFQLVSSSWTGNDFLSYLWINVANINSEIRLKNHFIFLKYLVELQTAATLNGLLFQEVRSRSALFTYAIWLETLVFKI